MPVAKVKIVGTSINSCIRIGKGSMDGKKRGKMVESIQELTGDEWKPRDLKIVGQGIRTGYSL